MSMAADMEVKQIYIINEDVNHNELKREILDYKFIRIKKSDTMELIARKILDCVD